MSQLVTPSLFVLDRGHQFRVVFLPRISYRRHRVSSPLPRLFAVFYVSTTSHHIRLYPLRTHVPGMICTRQQPTRAELFRSGAFFVRRWCPGHPCIFVYRWQTAVQSMRLCSKDRSRFWMYDLLLCSTSQHSQATCPNQVHQRERGLHLNSVSNSINALSLTGYPSVV